MLPSLAAPYVHGSATSRAAAQVAVTVMPLRRKEVYVAILLAEGAGRTDEEVAELTGIDLNTIRPRRGELARDGWIRNVGTRRTRSGCQAVVWVANEIPRGASLTGTEDAHLARMPSSEPRARSHSETGPIPRDGSPAETAKGRVAPCAPCLAEDARRDGALPLRATREDRDAALDLFNQLRAGAK